MSALQRTTPVSAPATRQALEQWSDKTLAAITREHNAHGEQLPPLFKENCRLCLMRALVKQDTSATAENFVNATIATKGKAYVKSAIEEYNMLEMGIDFIAVPPFLMED